jgi:hypothetical protein
MAYAFDRPSTSEILFSIGSFSGEGGAFTLATLFRITETGVYHTLYDIETSVPAGLNQHYIHPSDATPVYYDNAANRDGGQSLTVNTWYVYAVTKATGAATARFHLKPYNSGTAWSQVDATGGTSNSWLTPGAGGHHRIGSNIGGGDWFDGEMVCFGIANTAFSDGAIQALDATTFSAWSGSSFTHLWGFESGSTITDRKSNGADETSRADITLVSDPAAWAWSGGTTYSKTGAGVDVMTVLGSKSKQASRTGTGAIGP